MTPSHLIELENEFPASDTKSKTRNVYIEKDNTLTSCLILSLKVIQSTLLKIRVGLFLSSTRNSFSKFN